MSTVITATPLAGRVAIVTGASSGIGEATAFRLATLGAKVAVAARRTDNLDALAARITAAGGTALALPARCHRPVGGQRGRPAGRRPARPGRPGVQQCWCSTDLTDRRRQVR